MNKLSFQNAHDFKIMGILNVTPDSFSDGGQFQQINAALAQTGRMIEEGADIIDIGGESTRPGAPFVSLEEESARVLPILRAIKSHFSIPISIDTQRTQMMQMAIDEGVSLINDVNALQNEGALEACAKGEVQVCLMHKQGTPQSMQLHPAYDNPVVEEVMVWLNNRLQAALFSGIQSDNIILDPGFGFGKTLEHNLNLLNHLSHFKVLGCPILVGLSRKTMIGQILDVPEMDRVIGSATAATVAYTQGARLFRVHDVRQTKEALKIMQALAMQLEKETTP